jgi:NTE family protein
LEKRASRAPWTGLVLSGGGARGAYEAGVMRYLRNEMPARIKSHMRFEVICGTSVGAINCCFLATYNHSPEIQGQALVDIWESLNIEGVYRVGFRELLSLPKFLFGSRGRGELDETIGPGRLGGFFNTSPLEQLVHNGTRWENIGINLASGDLKALAIISTHVGSGQTHVFVQRSEPGLPAWSTDPQVQAFHVDIGPNHALASAAIPWIFPSVEIGGEVYCDGGIKLNTPISPAVRLGADRLLVIGLKASQKDKIMNPHPIDRYPSAFFLLGKILNALMLDKTEYELKRLERINAFLDVKNKLNKDLSNSLNAIVTPLRGAPYRPIETLVIRPSEDISKIAGRHLRQGGVAARAGGLIGPLLRRIGGGGEDQANDLLSYLLFDGEFAKDLIQLGMHDADAQRKEIIDFFDAS